VLESRKSDQWYVEPFVGGANMIDKVDGNRLAADNNIYLVFTLKALSEGWIPPKTLTESEYADIKLNPDKYPYPLVGFVGFACSYGAKWFGGYCRGKTAKGVPRDYIREAYRNVMKQANLLKGIRFKHSSYSELEIPAESIIYCDPPYANTTRYKSFFEHEPFWQWCREKSADGHSVFVSEYTAPDDFECVWQKEINSSLTKNTGSKKGIEKLFKPKSGTDPLIK
jgi:DNA adenine methylase